MAKEKDSERRALMRRIWKLNLDSDEGRFRLQRFSEPWLVENFYMPELAHLNHELRVKFDSHRTIDQLPRWERVQRFRQSIPYLYHRAQIALDKGMSYRDFKVGTALLAFKEHQPHDLAWKAFAGMNTKHARNMRPVCSEPIAINAAYAENFSLVIGMVIVGDLREEDIGKILTLHPCQDCRWFMDGHPLIDRNTLILTVPPRFHGFGYWSSDWDPQNRVTKKIFELRTAGQMLDLHRRISGDDFT